MEALDKVPNREEKMTKYVWVLILDYRAEPDWAVLGIFETEELAEKYRLYCEERDRDRLRIEKVVLNHLRYDDVPE